MIFNIHAFALSLILMKLTAVSCAPSLPLRSLPPSSSAEDSDAHSSLTKRATNVTIPQKVGLVWANGEDANLYRYKTNRTQFLYTWSPNCPKQAAALGLNCARMLWGTKQLATFRQLRNTSGTTHLMGMNEVNLASQSNLTVAQGVQLWNAEIRPFKQLGYKLVSPSVTTAPSGIKWWQNFFATCGGTDKCGVDILAVHYYGTNTADFQAYVTKCWQLFGLPIWVTEFGAQNYDGKPQITTADQATSYMKTMKAWLDQQPYVQQYFAFGLLHNMYDVNPLNQLMAANATPTALGNLYINT